jgi:AsmA protein
MKRLFSLLGLILIAAVGTFFLIPYVVSAQTIRESVADQLEALTGREVVVSGPASLSVFPSVSVRIGGVSIANAEGMGQEAFIAMDELDVSVRLMPLLLGDVEIEHFVAVRPRFNFTVNAADRPNWRLGGVASKASETRAKPASSPAAAPVKIGTFLIRDGQIKYRNQRSGAAIDTSSINATVTWPSLASPMATAGSLVWRGEVLSFKTRSDDPIGLASGGTTPASVMVESSRFTVDVKGQFSTTVDFAVDGRINLQVPSVRALARWFDAELPQGLGLNKLSLASKFLVGGTKLAFSEAALGLDGNTAEGAIVVTLGGRRPQLQATLAASTFDLNPYLPARAAPSKESASGKDVAPAAPRAGWSVEPIDMSGLATINADLRLSAGKISARNYDLGSGAITASLKDGRLTAQVAELKAYGGQINATLAVDGSDEAPAVTTNFNVQGVALLKFLTDMAGFSRLDGKGDISGNLQATGGSMNELVESLSGKFTLAAQNGAIKGMDLAGIVQILRGKRLEGWLTAAGKDTKFDRLQAEFYFDKGIGENKDFLLKGPAIDITGSGLVDLPKRSLDYRLSASLVSLPADAATPPETALALPLIVRGPWESPDIYPDPVKLDKAAPQIKEIIENVKDAVKNGDLKRLEDAAREGGLEAILKSLPAAKPQ